MKHVGVDGCRAGWLAVRVEGGQGRALWSGGDVYPDFGSLWLAHADAASIWVDIPIGLPGPDLPARDADRLARKLLGKRSSSIFSPMSRLCLDCTSWAEANKKNRQVVGKGFSKQSWMIAPKIKDVDSFLALHPEARANVLESHPELCFALAVGAPLLHSKKHASGVEERLDILEFLIPGARDFHADVRRDCLVREVAHDDIPDAMILAVAAFLAGNDPAGLPEPPQQDDAGLSMAIRMPRAWLFLKKQRSDP
ncbi:DUF429 domain-containing protein [Pseudodesulfovibrio tunisiensis]|uniref:DUF429 domain-containing protein n=1 Tax=Pseudodesulfovibrio tunisiensis TaxID=463192 RepID=UPI001FB1B02C|nr:DUF429 domain-containing protein [Pseudodesulfovibrio tunisiensis]